MSSQVPAYEDPATCLPLNGAPALALHAAALDKQQVMLYAAHKMTRWIFCGKYEAAADDALRCVFRCSAWTDLLTVSVYVSEACTVRVYCDQDSIYDGAGPLDPGTAALEIPCQGNGWYSLPTQRLTAAADGSYSALQPGVGNKEGDVIIWITLSAGILRAATVQELSYAIAEKALTTSGGVS
jgi:hypothetical protein